MRLVDKQILRELIGPFLFGVAAFTSVFFAVVFLPKLTQAMMNGMPLTQAIEVMVLSLPGIIVYTFPMGTLLGVLLGVGRLSSDSEVTALFSGGVSIFRMAVPIVAVGLLVSGATIVLNEYIAPRATTRYQFLMDAALKREARTEQSFTIADDASGSLIHVDAMDPETGTLKNVTVIQFDQDKKPRVLVCADRAKWEGLQQHGNRYRWKLYNGYTQPLGEQTTGAKSCWSSMYTRDLQKTPQEFELFQKKPDEMNFGELSRKIKYLKASPVVAQDKIRQLDVDRWNKLAFPLSSLVFAMLAAPLAIRPQRSSSSVGFGLSILLIFAYWVLGRYTAQLAMQGSIDPLVGAFAADVVGIIGAIVLLKRAAK